MYKIRDLSLSLFYYNCEHLSKFDFSKETNIKSKGCGAFLAQWLESLS